MLVLPDEKRHLFQEPFGEIYSQFTEIIPLLLDSTVYTVGDVVTASCINHNIIPAVAITDGKTMRKPYPANCFEYEKKIFATNPPGTITEELLSAIKEALEDQPAHIMVSGEEDLAVVPLVIASIEGPVLLYGQPDKGVVLLYITADTKKKAHELFSCFVTKKSEE
ncbi:MAG: DUF359 domain-containing protein [Methanospirillaceae archaeon]|nr:DUF359 domain-containing protein [Methanospirillaceae archaeon]